MPLPPTFLDPLLAGRATRVTVSADGGAVTDAPVPAAVLPGSFDPVHRGHLELARVAAEHVSGDLAFELAVRNVDKPPLAAETVRRRVAQFAGLASVELTTAPTFRDKARLLPGVTFVVGADTAARLLDEAYYGGSSTGMADALAEIDALGCRFLVAGRVEPDGAFRTLAEIAVPSPWSGLFTAIPAEHFRLDLSSTQLRAGHSDG